MRRRQQFLPRRGSLAWRFLMACIHCKETRMTKDEIVTRFHAFGSNSVARRFKRWIERGVLARYPEGYGIGGAWL